MNDTERNARAALLADDAAQDAAAGLETTQTQGAATDTVPPASAAPLASVPEGESPLVPLGKRGGVCYYYSRPHGCLYELAPEKHTRLSLLAVASLADYASWLYPDMPLDAVERQEAAILRRASRRLLEMTAGKIFNPAAVRARGIWRDDETGGVLYNTGAACYLATGNAAPVQVDAVRDGHIYTAAAALPAPAEFPLSDEQGRAVLEFLSARSWTWEHAGELLTGFLVNAILAGCMPFRGHVWVNAPRNTGKTALRDDLLSLLSPFCSVSDGSVSTPAALRADLNGAPLPVICDEQDADAGDARSSSNVAKKLELARIASKGGKVSMGTTGGGVTRDFTLLSCFLFLSVDNALSRDTDLTRWALLRLRACKADELDKLLARQRAARAKLPPRGEIIACILARLLRQSSALLANLPPLTEALRRGGAEPRRAEMFAAWMAGAHALLHGGVMDSAAIAHAVDVMKSYAGQEEAENDFARCIDCLRAARVSVRGIQYSVETLCRIYARAGDGESREDMRAALASCGIQYVPYDKLLLQTSPAFIGLLFRGTEFERRAVSVLTAGCCAASRVNEYGVRLTSAKQKGSLTPRRCVSIPASFIEDDPPQE